MPGFNRSFSGCKGFPLQLESPGNVIELNLAVLRDGNFVAREEAKTGEDPPKIFESYARLWRCPCAKLWPAIG